MPDGRRSGRGGRGARPGAGRDAAPGSGRRAPAPAAAPAGAPSGAPTGAPGPSLAPPLAGPDRAGLAARRAAWRLLDAVRLEGMLLADARAAALLAPLAPAERARAQRLAAETLRDWSRAEAWLAPRLRKPPPGPVLSLLALAATEIGRGEAPHGVVNAAVALLGEGRRTEGFRGLANAVLHRLAEAGPAAWAALPPPRLPPWLRDRLVAAWGEAATLAIEAAHAAGAPLDITARADPAALAARLGGTLLPTGSVRLPPAQVTALPGWHAGEFWVQDAAAALPARLLDPRPGERVLDLCAAPGGKTLQIAAAGAQVTAVDASAPRLALLHDNLARTGLPARVLERDVLEVAERGWDAILLDAPCSATGTIRRHPDLPFARDGSGLPALVALQDRLLDHALGLLRPGGRLVFATCSLLPEEGEARLAAALARHPGLAVEAPDLPGLDPAWAAPGGGLRTLPHHWGGAGGLDGFFAARLRAPGGGPG